MNINFTIKLCTSDKIITQSWDELEDNMPIPDGNCEVSTKIGMTFNLPRDFEILKVDIGVKITCDRESAGNGKAHDALYNYLEKRMKNFIDEKLPEWKNLKY